MAAVDHGFVGVRLLAVAWLATVSLVACSSTVDTPAPDERPAGSADVLAARSELLARVAAASDARFIAEYEWTRKGETLGTVTVTRAADGTWRVDLPGRGDDPDAMSIVWTSQGFFWCPLSPKPECVRVADLTGELPDDIDPVVPHAFTDWLEILLDRHVPFSVAYTDPAAGVPGRCFSLVTNSVNLKPPIPEGDYCFRDDGVITAVTSSFGKLTATGTVLPPSATADLPGPIVEEPSESPSPSPSASRSAD